MRKVFPEFSFDVVCFLRDCDVLQCYRACLQGFVTGSVRMFSFLSEVTPKRLVELEKKTVAGESGAA
jgi:hypothetical protein